MAVNPDHGATPVFAMAAPSLAQPSKQDIINQLQFFFGKPSAPEKLANFTDHHAATYQFPDAFTGPSPFLRETLSNIVLKSPQTWQTSIGLPYVQIEGVNVQWDEMHFDVRLLQRVPVRSSAPHHHTTTPPAHQLTSSSAHQLISSSAHQLTSSFLQMQITNSWRRCCTVLARSTKAPLGCKRRTARLIAIAL